MSRALNSVQSRRKSRTHIHPLTLIRITAYADRLLKTGESNIYISDRVVLYDYGNTGAAQTFRPSLGATGGLGVGLLRATMANIPDPNGTQLLRKSVEVILENGTLNGVRTIQTLRAHNIEGATIEISQILLDEQEATVDLSAFAGNEHTILFIGEIHRVAPVTETTIALQCRTPMPSASWLTATEQTTDPRDVGVRMPIVMGQAKNIPLINYDVGWRTTLGVDLTDSETGAKAVVDGSRFPSGTFTVQIGAEQIEITAKADASITINTRGFNSTTALAHSLGATVFEVPTNSVAIANAKESDAVGAVYIVSPHTGERVLIASSLYVESLADTSTISGETVTSITISAANLKTLLDDLAAGVAQQPEFDTPSTDTVRAYLSAFAERNANNWLNPASVSVTAECTAAGLSGTPPGGRLEHSTSETDSTSYWVPTGTAPSGGRTVKRFRIVTLFNYEGHPSDDTRLYISADMFGTSCNAFFAIPSGASITFNASLVTTWYTPSGSPTVSDLERSTAPTANGDEDFVSYFFLNVGADASSSTEFAFVFASQSYVECELAPEALARTADVEVSGAGGITGMRLSADVDGVPAPGAVAFNATYSLDGGTWSESIGSSADDTDKFIEGASSRRMDVGDADGSLVIDASSISGWTGVNVTLTTAFATFLGRDVVAGDADSAAACSMRFFNSTPWANLTDVGAGIRVLTFGMMSRGDNVDPLIVRIGSADGSDYLEWHIETETRFFDLNPAQIFLDYTQATDATNGTFDPANVRYLYFGWNNDADPDGSNNACVVSDVFTLETKWVIQNNALGGIDFSSPAGQHRIFTFLRRGLNLGFYDDKLTVKGGWQNSIQLDIEVSSTTGTGTAQEAVRRTYTFPSANLPAHGATVTDFTAIDSVSFADTGSPTITAIETFRIIANMTLHGVGFAQGTALVWNMRFDGFQSDLSTGPIDYIATAGAVMTSPIDLLRWWLTEIGGETVDAASFTTAETNLASHINAGDLRFLGGTWEEVAAKLAYLCRSNLIPIETTTGRQWRLLQAGATYLWDDSTTTLIAEWRGGGFVEAGRDLDELATSHRYHYDRDFALDSGDEGGYQEALIANAEQNDLSALVPTIDIDDAESTFGRIEADPRALALIADQTTAINVAGYYVSESLRIAPLYVISGVAWWEAYGLEIGDIITVTPPWEVAARTCRIIEYTKDFNTEQIEIRCVEVPT